jgi:hypothetical protein
MSGKYSMCTIAGRHASECRADKFDSPVILEHRETTRTPCRSRVASILFHGGDAIGMASGAVAKFRDIVIAQQEAAKSFTGEVGERATLNQYGKCGRGFPYAG